MKDIDTMNTTLKKENFLWRMIETQYAGEVVVALGVTMGLGEKMLEMFVLGDHR